MGHAGGRTLQEIDVISPLFYAQNGYPHEEWTRLRREDPVSYYECSDAVSFWAINKHADIVEISKQPAKFISAPRLTVELLEDEDRRREFPPTLINMDPPQHGDFRQLISRRFTRSALQRMQHDIERIAGEVLDDLAADGLSEIDFVEKVAAPVPIAVIAWMLGLPGRDWELLFRWTNELIGSADPEYQREGEGRRETSQRAMGEVFAYFSKLVEERRKNPQDDLISLFIHGDLGSGRKLDLGEILSYCLIIVVAGNETTRNATSGGMLAFIEHPEQWNKLRENPGLMKPALEEVLRWTSPIIHFCRTAACDYELRGKQIREGDTLALFYPSANRDEDVFDDPFEFRIERHPNRHLAFGVGEHFCLGAHVARTELEVIFRHMLQRVEHMELAGDPQRLRSSLVGGLKHVPMRYRLKAA